MGDAYINNNQHVIFSTHERRPLIIDQAQMWAYIGGIVRNVGAIPMAIGGMADHAHVLASLPATMDIADFVSKVKANSSRWMNEKERGFAWQRGYAAFSVSVSNLAAVTRYIETQPAHHAKRDFQGEFIALLKKHNVPYDARYVFA
jgi:putative transposase